MVGACVLSAPALHGTLLMLSGVGPPAVVVIPVMGGLLLSPAAPISSVFDVSGCLGGGAGIGGFFDRFPVVMCLLWGWEALSFDL